MATGIRAAVISIVVVGAVACSSGGGGGGSLSQPGSATFSSFGAITPNQTVAMDAIAVTANATGTTDAARNVTVDSVSFTGPAPGTVRLSFDGSRQLSALVIETPQPNSSASFDRNATGHSIVCSDATCVASNPTASAGFTDPFHSTLNWNYQSFGVWAVDTGPGSAVFGALSAGTPTPGSALPFSGSAVFNGLTAGFFVDGAGTPFGTASTLTADVDFSARTIAFNTSNMALINLNSGAESTSSDLRLTGTLNYASGVNSFGGSVRTSHPTVSERLNGSASGRFYGPAAQEMGGVYTLSGSGRERMMGGFGAKR